MVWGGISVRSPTELLVLNGTLTGQRYINEVLQPVVLPCSTTPRSAAG